MSVMRFALPAATRLTKGHPSLAPLPQAGGLGEGK